MVQWQGHRSPGENEHVGKPVAISMREPASARFFSALGLDPEGTYQFFKINFNRMYMYLYVFYIWLLLFSIMLVRFFFFFPQSSNIPVLPCGSKY